LTNYYYVVYIAALSENAARKYWSSIIRI